jgi:hypothetical protein
MFILDQKLNKETIRELQKTQQMMTIPLTDTVPANSSKLCSVAVGNAADFVSMFITGSFETLCSVISGGLPYTVDDGVDYLRGQLKDSIGSKVLSTEHIPFSLLLTPGRRRSASATNNVSAPFVGCAIATPPNQLFYPLEFEHLYQSTSNIQIDVINASNVALSFDIVFWGAMLWNVPQK